MIFFYQCEQHVANTGQCIVRIVSNSSITFSESRFSCIFVENQALLVHFFRLYLRAEESNRLEIARFVRFRQCRFGFKKIRWKQFAGSRRYDRLHFGKKDTPKIPVWLTNFVEPLSCTWAWTTYRRHKTSPWKRPEAFLSTVPKWMTYMTIFGSSCQTHLSWNKFEKQTSFFFATAVTTACRKHSLSVWLFILMFGTLELNFPEITTQSKRSNYELQKHRFPQYKSIPRVTSIFVRLESGFWFRTSSLYSVRWWRSNGKKCDWNAWF